MRALNSAEGGTATTTVTTGNSGAGSGSAFDAVSIGTLTTLTFDSTASAHGSLSLRWVASVGSAGAYCAWQAATIGSSRPQLFFRVSVLVVSLPVTDLPVASFFGSSSLRASLSVTSTGALRWKNAAGSTIQTTTNVLTANTWARVEGRVIGDASAGLVETRLYLTLDSLTATETQNSAITQALGGTLDEVRWGDTSGAVGTLALDDLGVTELGYLGSASLSYTNYTPSLTVLGVLSSPARSYVNFTPTVSVLSPRAGYLNQVV